jgi:CRISPR/Cas system-associated exonuclease Cas4 (RecB family)
VSDHVLVSETEALACKTLSYSAWRSYLECPCKYLIYKTKKLPAPTKAMTQGLRLHSNVETGLLKRQFTGSVFDKSMIGFLKNEILGGRTLDYDLSGTVFSTNDFLTFKNKSRQPKLAIEADMRHLHASILGCDITGRIDLLCIRDDRFVICDWKKSHYVTDESQLYFYAMAVRLAIATDPELKARFERYGFTGYLYYFEHDRKSAPWNRVDIYDVQMRDYYKWVAKTIREIRSLDTLEATPDTKKCGMCQFYPCQDWVKEVVEI